MRKLLRACGRDGLSEPSALWTGFTCCIRSFSPGASGSGLDGGRVPLSPWIVPSPLPDGLESHPCPRGCGSLRAVRFVDGLHLLHPEFFPRCVRIGLGWREGAAFTLDRAVPYPGRLGKPSLPRRLRVTPSRPRCGRASPVASGVFPPVRPDRAWMAGGCRFHLGSCRPLSRTAWKAIPAPAAAGHSCGTWGSKVMESSCSRALAAFFACW